MKTFTPEDYSTLMHNINITMIISGTVFEITNHALYYSILLVPYMDGPNSPHFIAIRLYKNDPDIIQSDYDWIKQIEPYDTIEIEVKRIYDSYRDLTHIRLIRIWAISKRSSIPVQYCPIRDFFNFILDENSPIQCCGESHEPIISYTPLITREEYLKKKGENNVI